MSREGMLGRLPLALYGLSNDGLNEILAQANLMGGDNGPAWIAHLKKTRKAGLPGIVAPATVEEGSCSVRPAYPEWADPAYINTPEFQALEQAGPTEFGLDNIEQWLHDGQKDGKWVRGQVVFDHLVATGELENHLGLADLQVIQKLGLATFRKHFAGKAVFGWKGVVRDRHGHLYAPHLFEFDDKVVLNWRWLNHDWDDRNPGLRFAS